MSGKRAYKTEKNTYGDDDRLGITPEEYREKTVNPDQCENKPV